MIGGSLFAYCCPRPTVMYRQPHYRQRHGPVSSRTQLTRDERDGTQSTAPMIRAKPLDDAAIPTAREPATKWDRLAFALFVVATAAVLVTFSDYGVTWDEGAHNRYGIFVLDYYLSWFTDLHWLKWGDLYNYGAAFDLAAAIVNHLSPFGTYETRHLLNGLVGLVGIIGVWKLGRALAGPRAGFI